MGTKKPKVSLSKQNVKDYWTFFKKSKST